MDLGTLAFLAAAAMAAGAMNSVAGGGSFLTFPALVLAGVGTIPANATNTIALWPGSMGSAVAYRDDFRHERRTLLILGVVSLLGGLAGAVLLLKTPEQTFRSLIPWLLGGATLLFALGPKLTKRLRGRQGRSVLTLTAGVAAAQFAISVYGGYFGAGIGILMLAALAVMGMEDIHAMNGLKTVLAAIINGIAVVAFVAAGIIVWEAAVPMVGGAIVGGYGGARLAKRVDPRFVRGFVIGIGTILTVAFALRGA